jgi:hypothetical protein
VFRAWFQPSNLRHSPHNPSIPAKSGSHGTPQPGAVNIMHNHVRMSASEMSTRPFCSPPFDVGSTTRENPACASLLESELGIRFLASGCVENWITTRRSREHPVPRLVRVDPVREWRTSFSTKAISDGTPWHSHGICFWECSQFHRQWDGT